MPVIINPTAPPSHIFRIEKFNNILNNYNTYDGYADLDDIDIFVLNSVLVLDKFRTLDLDTQSKYLNMASLEIDRKYKFKGEKTNCNQNLEFPRSGLYVGCKLLGANDTPQNIIFATITLANNLYNSHSLENADPNSAESISSSAHNIKSEKIGCVERSYFKASESATKIKIKTFADNMAIYLKPYLIDKYYIGRG